VAAGSRLAAFFYTVIATTTTKGKKEKEKPECVFPPIFAHR
jgi:hypothetical protein